MKIYVVNFEQHSGGVFSSLRRAVAFIEKCYAPQEIHVVRNDKFGSLGRHGVQAYSLHTALPATDHNRVLGDMIYEHTLDHSYVAVQGTLAEMTRECNDRKDREEPI